jgi:hypothetical protein
VFTVSDSIGLRSAGGSSRKSASVGDVNPNRCFVSDRVRTHRTYDEKGIETRSMAHIIARMRPQGFLRFSPMKIRRKTTARTRNIGPSGPFVASKNLIGDNAYDSMIPTT